MASSVSHIATGERPSLLDRERGAFAAHRAALAREGALRARELAPRGTFLHGFLLPFSLIVAALRTPKLRASYLKLFGARLAALVVLTLLFVHGKPDRPELAGSGPRVLVSTGPDSKDVKVDLPLVHVDIDPKAGKKDVVLAGRTIPVVMAPRKKEAPRGLVGKVEEPAPAAPAAAPDAAPAPAPAAETAPPASPSKLARLAQVVAEDWKILLAILAALSAVEGVVVFLSRRWDDWMSFHVAAAAGILPEDATPKEPKVGVDVGWLFRKTLRRVRGYVLFATGIPAFALLNLLPHGEWLFRLALTAWGYYWLGVFSAGKSAHAWADGEAAPAPAPIRALAGAPGGRAAEPLRAYGRVWARIVRSVNPAASTFERSPASFLGLALARAVLALPGLYLLARPVIPVAAGRLAAESDPAGRFWAP